MIIINIANDFSDTPGGRYERDGLYSGEKFREEILIPKYTEAMSKNEKLQINLDGCFGLPSSFLDEVFGGLARKLKSNKVLDIIEFISFDQPKLIEDINKYVKTASF